MKAIAQYGAQAVLGRALGAGEIRRFDYVNQQITLAKMKREAERNAKDGNQH